MPDEQKGKCFWCYGKGAIIEPLVPSSRQKVLLQLPKGMVVVVCPQCEGAG